MKRKPAVVCLCIVIFLLAPTGPVGAQWDDMDQSDVRGHTMYTVFEPGFIPAILEPEFITVSEARDLYQPNEPLVVVADEAGAHAYSLWHLEEHLVVNDYINGRAITVTW